MPKHNIAAIETRNYQSMYADFTDKTGMHTLDVRDGTDTYTDAELKKIETMASAIVVFSEK